MNFGPNLKLEVKLITPSDAMELLARNIGNRPIANHTVQRYARSINNRSWVIAEPILLDDHGNLLDGQHRLLAVAETGVPTYFAVVSGYDRESVFLHLGKGKVRSMADDLALKGVENASVVAPVINLFHMLVTGRLRSGIGGENQVTPDESWELIQEIGMDRIQAAIAAVPQQMKKVANRSLMVALYLKFSELDKVLADHFMEALACGTGLSASDPIYVLRERLIDARQDKKKKLRMTEACALTIKTWNKLRGAGGSTVSNSIRWRSRGSRKEEFPVPQ